MAYVTIPKDLSKVQSKVLFGLTKRQVICFGTAALIGVPLFFLAKGALGTTTAVSYTHLLDAPAPFFTADNAKSAVSRTASAQKSVGCS